MAHGCAAPAPAVGPAPVVFQRLYIILLTTVFVLPVDGKICLTQLPELIIDRWGDNRD
jgi:hypothetical protein